MATQSVTQTGNIVSLLREGVIGITGNYEKYSNVSRKVMKVMKTHRFQEIIPEMQYTPTAQVQAEGSNANYSTIGQLFTTVATQQKFQCGVILTREACDDNLYPQYFPLIEKRLTFSHLNNEEISFANLINNGFINNASTNLADGQPWFSTLHPLGQGLGTSSNTFASPTQLNSTSLLLALSQLKFQFKDAAGMPLVLKGMKLIVSPDLWPVAVPLLGSKFNPDTASNAINPIFSEIDELLVSPFLNAGTWVVTTEEMGIYRFDRIPLEISVFPDSNNYEVRINSYRRFVDCVVNWRSAFASRNP